MCFYRFAYTVKQLLTVLLKKHASWQKSCEGNSFLLQNVRRMCVSIENSTVSYLHSFYVTLLLCTHFRVRANCIR